MKNLLFISSYPFPLDMGSNQHAYFFIKALSHYFNIYCVFFLAPNKLPFSDTDENLSELNIKDYRLCYFRTPSRSKKIAYLLKRIIAFPNYYMHLAKNPQSLKTINECVKQYSIDIIHFEHFHYTRYAFSIKSNVKKVIVYHDLHHLIYKQQMRFETKYHHKFIPFAEFMKFYVFERLLERCIHAKIFLNPIEMQSLPKNAIHIPHIVNPEIRYKDARYTQSYNILFLGAYNHPPNRISLQFIIEQILPKLVQTTKKFKIHIVGAGTKNFNELLNNSKYKGIVTIRGFVEDINQVFADMDIALFPILYGGGIKTKVIDAMAAGVPVVTSPQGIFGLSNLPKNTVGVGTKAEQILKELNALMNSHSLRLKRAKSGREYVEKQHSFKIFAKKIKDAYLDF
jgi:glycosyltransferase involved in cell wall biosynthesis